MKNRNGITLIALIITVIIMLILAGVALSAISGDAGLFSRVQKTAELYNNSAEKESEAINSIIDALNYYGSEHDKYEGGQYSEELGLCTPILGDNMVGVYWSDGTTLEDGKYKATALSPKVEVTSDDKGFAWSQWYDYVAGDNSTDTKKSRWANAKNREDGSYFVWIPRYEYNLTNEHKSEAGEITVKFISKNTTTATDGYKIHPAFTTNLDLGGWDKDIAGIWVAKYQMSQETSTDNSTWTNEASSATNDNTTTDKNATGLDIYRRAVSKPNYTPWNYISISEAYDNSFKYSRENESHLMKNSEWGATAYLTHSQYGRNGKEIAINTYSKSNSELCTGYGSEGKEKTNEATIDDENRYNGNIGMKASTTGNIYGIYDMAGALAEQPSEYHGNDSYEHFENGTSLISQAQEKSTKYVTKYPGDKASIDENYSSWGHIYGDAVWETSGGLGKQSWFGNESDNDTFNMYEEVGYGIGNYFGRGSSILLDNDEFPMGIFTFGDDKRRKKLLYWIPNSSNMWLI